MLFEESPPLRSCFPPPLDGLLWWQLDGAEVQGEINRYHEPGITRSYRGLAALFVFVPAAAGLILTLLMTREFEYGCFLLLALPLLLIALCRGPFGLVATMTICIINNVMQFMLLLESAQVYPHHWSYYMFDWQDLILNFSALLFIAAALALLAYFIFQGNRWIMVAMMMACSGAALQQVLAYVIKGAAGDPVFVLVYVFPVAWWLIMMNRLYPAYVVEKAREEAGLRERPVVPRQAAGRPAAPMPPLVQRRCLPQPQPLDEINYLMRVAELVELRKRAMISALELEARKADLERELAEARESRIALGEPGGAGSKESLPARSWASVA